MFEPKETHQRLIETLVENYQLHATLTEAKTMIEFLLDNAEKNNLLIEFSLRMLSDAVAIISNIDEEIAEEMTEAINEQIKTTTLH